MKAPCRVALVLFACWVAVLVAWLAFGAEAATERTHTVQQILRAQKTVSSAAGVTVTPREGQTETTIRRGETIADGTRIDVPAQSNLVIVIVSTGGKSTVTLEPGASVTFVSTGQGELIASSGGGNTIFSVVPRGLDFFRVVGAGEAITAAVHGTVLSVDSANRKVTCTCTRGTVNITKRGYVLIGAARKKASLIDVISAAKRPQVSYKPGPMWHLASFANFAQAESFYARQLRTAQQSDDANAVSAALRNFGYIEDYQGRYAQALRSYGQALAIYRQSGDREGEAGTLLSIGSVEADRGRNDDALHAHQQALALFRQLGDRDGEARTLHGIGRVEESGGRNDDALESYRQALALYRQLGESQNEADARDDISRIKANRGAL
jgi:hypothetical protein